MTDRIERSVSISAPLERVWSLITTAEALGQWFGDAGASVDLTPGGRLSLHWHEHGTVHGRVVAVEPPRRFAFRWLHDGPPDADATPVNSTLVEFTLTADGEGCRVDLVESGFAALGRPATDRTALLADHAEGWGIELGHLAAHA